MDIIFYVSAVIAIISSIMVITRLNAVHALLYLILSLLAVALIFYVLGAHFVAALEVIINAGAIMVLFLFVIMMLNLGPATVLQEKLWLKPSMWIIPALFASVLLLEFLYAFILVDYQIAGANEISPRDVGISLFSTYLLGVEIAGLLLMAGIVGAYHLGKQKKSVRHRFLEEKRKTGKPL